jgi:hypothetical protein
MWEGLYAPTAPGLKVGGALRSDRFRRDPNPSGRKAPPTFLRACFDRIGIWPSVLRHLSSVLRQSAVALCVGGCLLTSVLCLTGCAGYQLGTGSTPKFATLYIAPITSEALIPQAQALVTTELREAFIRDGRVTLVNSAESADAVLTVTLAAYNRTVAVSRPDDTGLARRFDVNLSARATLTDNRTKQPLFSARPLEAKRGAFTDSGLVPSEYQALPLLAGQLASEAVHATLDTW